jgi:hypothetical protein
METLAAAAAALEAVVGGLEPVAVVSLPGVLVGA